MGGLAAAGTLSSYFDEILVLERDILPPLATSRVGTPQDRHPHVLLAGGLQALDDILPGFEKDLADAGAVSVNVFRDLRYERPDVGALPRRDCGLSILCASRPQIERVLRKRVSALANVTLRSQCRVSDIAWDSPRSRVGFESGERGSVAVEADLVVDASGRGAPTLALLDALGWEQPAETVVGVDIRYTTAVLPAPAGVSSDWKMAATLPDPRASVLGAMVLPVEDGRCLVTVSEHGASERADTWEAFLAMLRRLNTPTIYNAVRHLPPPEGLRHFVFDESRWRHFERLQRLPRGVLPFADSVCRFNPIYGQGMTVAAREAKLLRDVLDRVAKEADPIGALQPHFMSGVASLLQAPWNMGVIADFAYPGTRGERPERYEESRQFEAALFRAVVADPVVQTAFSGVVQLVKPFEYLEDPEVRSRIEAHAEVQGA
jgi:2-polyprenyl-6-methoxyphenol hydroxylase-like FAD-dependent oxidoreductase